MKKKVPNFKRNRNTNLIRKKQKITTAMLRLHYRFWILFGVLILAGISIVLRLETPVVWTFLYGIGGWAALTTNPKGNLH